MKINKVIKTTIDNCQIKELIKILKINRKVINVRLNIDKKMIHWIYHLYEHCGKNSVENILDSNVINSNNLKYKDNISLVWQAYLDQKYDLVEILLNYGASSILDEGFTLLHWVSSNGDEKMLRTILLNNKNLTLDVKDMINENKDRTPLHWAAQENQVEAGSILLEYGANKEIRNFNGKTSLHIASSNGNKEFVELLLEAGADRTSKDNFNITPEKYAELYGHMEIKNILVSQSKE